MIEETKEASNRRDSLLGGSISETDAKIELLTTDPKGEYTFDKAFLYLIEEHGLSLY